MEDHSPIEMIQEKLDRGQCSFRPGVVRKLLEYAVELRQQVDDKRRSSELPSVSGDVQPPGEGMEICCLQCRHAEDHFFSGATRYASCFNCGGSALDCAGVAGYAPRHDGRWLKEADAGAEAGTSNEG